MWQDWLFLIGGGVLDLGFLPTLIGKQKPSQWTAAMFLVVLAAFGFGFLTLGLYLSTIAQWVGAIMWGATLFQSRQK